MNLPKLYQNVLNLYVPLPEVEIAHDPCRLGDSTIKVSREMNNVRVNLPSYALQPRNDNAVGAHCGRADQGPEMDPRRRSRLVERTAVGEGG